MDKESDGVGIHELLGYAPTLEEAQLEEPKFPRTLRWTARLHIQMRVQFPALEAWPLPPLPSHGRNSRSSLHPSSIDNHGPNWKLSVFLTN